MSIKTKDFFLKPTFIADDRPPVFRLPTMPPSFIRELGWEKKIALQFVLDTKRGVIIIRKLND
jgi:hypothetical protein